MIHETKYQVYNFQKVFKGDFQEIFYQKELQDQYVHEIH